MLSTCGTLAVGALLALGATATPSFAASLQDEGDLRLVPWEHQWTEIAEPQEAAAADAGQVLEAQVAPRSDERPEPVTAFQESARRAAGELQRLPSERRHAGIYHVATGTWTRARQDLGPAAADVVYNNSLPSGYFSTIGASGALGRGSAVVDSGGLPTAANGSAFSTTPDRTSYTIDAFEFAYCDFSAAPGSSAWRFRFYESHEPCSAPTVAPAASYEFTHLPSNGCWTLVFDLSGNEFCLQGDGGALNPGWNSGDPARDSFGFSATYLGPAQAGSFLAGPLLAGDPDSDESGYRAGNPNGTAACGGGACGPAPHPTGANATFFEVPGLCASSGASSLADVDGSGYLMDDGFWVENTGGGGCFFFGGYFNRSGCGTASANPFGSMHLVLTARAGECSTPSSLGTSYCPGGVNSIQRVADLSLLGSPLLIDDDVELRVDGLPHGSIGVFLASRYPGQLTLPGVGPFCVRRDVGRFRGPGQVRVADALGRVVLDAAASEWSNAAIPRAAGVYSASVGDRTHFQFWYRERSQGAAVTNLSDGEFLDWQ